MGDAADQLDEQMQRLYYKYAPRCQHCHTFFEDGDEGDGHVCKPMLEYEIEQLARRVTSLERLMQEREGR